MNRNDCLNKLKEACNNLSQIGNVVEFKKNNPNDLYVKIQPVIQYYKYIQNNFKNDEFALIESLSSVLEIGENNPSLKSVVDVITEDKKLNIDREEKNDSFDKTSFIDTISALFEEIRSQKNYNTIEDYQIEFQKSLEVLDNNKQFFSREEFEYLNSAIRGELFKIDQIIQLDEEKIKTF